MHTPEELAPAVATAFRYDSIVMIERFVPGRELTVAILGDEALPVIEIVPVKTLYDYECKYTPGMAKEFVAELAPDTARRLADAARTAFDACGMTGYGRVDFRLDPAGTPWCLECNTLPGMTPTSLVPQAADAAGISFDALCQRIVSLAVS